MKRKNNLIKLAMVLVCLLGLATAAAAQKRRPAAKRPASKPVAAAATNVPPVNASAEVKEAANKVSAQIKNVTRFIYLLGSIAQGIEDVDNDIKARKASPAAVQINARNKESVIAALQKLRADLVPVEVDFRAKPALRTYVPQIGGISDLAQTAEDQAASGQLKEAGRTLLGIIEKLSDALVAMP